MSIIGMKSYKYPYKLQLIQSLRSLESALSLDNNIEYLRDLNTGLSTIEFSKQVSLYIDAIEGERFK